MNDLIMAHAREYGLHVKGGDWRLGLLVALSVKKGKSEENLPGKSLQTTNVGRQTQGKVTLAAFAKASGVGLDRVRNHFDGWEKAAEAGLVPAADTLDPGSEVKLDRDKLGEFSEYYTPVSGGYNGGADRIPTVSNVKAGLDKLTPAQRGEILADLVHDDQAFAEAPVHAKQQFVAKASEMLVEGERKSKAKLNEGSKDVSGWNHAQAEISDAALHLSKALEEILQLQHGMDIANDKSLFGVRSAIERCEMHIEQIRMATGITEEVA